MAEVAAVGTRKRSAAPRGLRVTAGGEPAGTMPPETLEQMLRRVVREELRAVLGPWDPILPQPADPDDLAKLPPPRRWKYPVGAVPRPEDAR